MFTVFFGLFVMAASCYLLFITSEPLEKIGGHLGRLLRLPEDVIASTFQALATSGPEIVMAILAATPFVANEAWASLQVGERACSGCLNMCFSAMDNLVGIGCVGMIFLLYRKSAEPNEVIKVEPSVIVGLIFYLVSSTLLCLFLTTSLRTSLIDGRTVLASSITEWQAWVLMSIGICYIAIQFFVPGWLAAKQQDSASMSGDSKNPSSSEGDNDDDDDAIAQPTSVNGWLWNLFKFGFFYSFLVFALVIFVRECLSATFDIATIGFASVGGIILMFTSYVSSFPEFMMTYRYAIAEKKSALLGMLFGSNVIDLAFAGFRAIWLHSPMDVYTTGKMQELFPYYLWCLPVLACLSLLGLTTGKFKYKHAYPLLFFYVIYIVSGFLLL